ncbi:hypothetical protein [Pelagibaculum spongiae]|uniref:Uncharacterized protein n=1 Tax=Pelagibaculum spongiae TaxID=2080658 RepID=A0A2V1GN56_9GAMM|nr:hypothetical protein [Pelagibaculum spongiae]PVZ63448.1 hypothetical protein DC094_21310 [Pelagibaculum spongiae]
MKIGMILGLSLLSFSAIADPTIFGMDLGKTTEKDLRELYDVRHTGTNKYSGGNMYSIPTSEIKFDGLKEVTTIFDINHKLIAVLTTLPKSKFGYVNKALGKKYKQISSKIPFVGNKSVKYRNEGTEITLDAPHMSFDMSMNYIRDDLMRSFKKQSSNERRNKQESESSQL